MYAVNNVMQQHQTIHILAEALPVFYTLYKEKISQDELGCKSAIESKPKLFTTHELIFHVNIEWLLGLNVGKGPKIFVEVHTLHAVDQHPFILVADTHHVV